MMKQNENETNFSVPLEIIKASEIEPREVKWLWYPYIPFGKVTLLQGDPGDGKSKLMLSIAALLSKGKPLPFVETEENEPMAIIYQTTEDDADDTVVDLKIRNDTDNTFQIEISFDDKYMYGRILSQSPVNIEYSVFNSSVSYIKRNGRTYQIAPVYRSERDKKTCRETGAELYINQCEIGYELPNDIKIEERGA